MRITIEPTQKFRDGRTLYEPGHKYEVEKEDGAYFVRCGWATSEDYTPPGVARPRRGHTHNIQPDDTSHGQTAQEV